MKRIEILLIGLTVLLSACGGHEEESAAMKEARETQGHLMEIAVSVKEKLVHETAEWRTKADDYLQKGDTVMAEKLQDLNARLEQLQIRMKQWEEDADGVGKGFHHDHENCDHDHSHDYVEELDPQQIGAIQAELKSQILALSDSLEILTKAYSDVDTTEAQP